MLQKSGLKTPLELTWVSLKETFLSFLKNKEILVWTIILPVFFFFLINIVILLRDSTLIEPPRQGIITIGIISFSVISFNLAILADKFLEDKNSVESGHLYLFVGKMLAYLVYTLTSVTILLIFGFIMGSDFDLSLNTVITSLYLLIMLIFASWGIGLIFSSLLRNNKKFVGAIAVFPIVTVIFFILSAVRTNFFNRFPQIIIDIINFNPFTLSPSMVVQLLVGDGWIVVFNPLSTISLIISSLFPIILFVIGVYIYNKFLVPKHQMITQEVEILITDEKSGSFFEMTKSATTTAMFPPIQFLTEAIFILIIFLLPFSLDIFLARMIVLFFSSILGILFIYFILIRLLRLGIDKTQQLPPLRSLKWVGIIFSLLWMSISLITIILDGISSIFGIKLPLFTGFDYLPVTYTDNILIVLFWLLSSTVILASFKEIWYRRTLIPLLEKRGVSTSLSLLSISFLYGLLNTLVELGLEVRFFQIELFSFATMQDSGTTLFHGLHLFIYTFLISLACGTIYIITRNVLYSIIVHSLTNLLILLTFSIPMLNIQILELAFSFITILLIIGGLFIILNSIIHQIPSLPSTVDWNRVIPKFSSKQVNRKFIGFLFFSTLFQVYLFFFGNIGIPGLIFFVFNLFFLFILIVNARSIFKTPKDNSEVQGVN